MSSETSRWTTERQPEDDAECERLGCEDKTHPVHHRAPASDLPELATLIASKWNNLDSAWKEAEDALPEGWNLRGVERDLWSLTHQPPEDKWFATAARGIETDRPDYAESDLEDTPAAALRALAARLRETPSGSLTS